MKKVYIAMKFNRDKLKDGLANQLENDLRSKLLRNKELIVTPTYPQIPDTELIYNGPFYCEDAGEDGCVTSTDCQAIVRSELKAIDSSDVIVCYLDEHMSAGSITEIMYAASTQKHTIIIYKCRDTKYDMKSKYWFSLVAVQQLNPNVQLIPIYGDIDVNELKSILLTIKEV